MRDFKCGKLRCENDCFFVVLHESSAFSIIAFCCVCVCIVTGILHFSVGLHIITNKFVVCCLIYFYLYFISKLIILSYRFNGRLSELVVSIKRHCPLWLCGQLIISRRSVDLFVQQFLSSLHVQLVSRNKI